MGIPSDCRSYRCRNEILIGEGGNSCGKEWLIVCAGKNFE